MSVPPGYRHFQREETGSTNADCLEMARSGDPGHLWITAGRQTAGAAAPGADWASEPGNLFASLLLIDPAPANALANLAFVAALAARDAIAAAALGADRVLT